MPSLGSRLLPLDRSLSVMWAELPGQGPPWGLQNPHGIMSHIELTCVSPESVINTGILRNCLASGPTPGYPHPTMPSTV